MKPDVDRLFEVASGQLMARISPALPTRYEQSNAMAMGALLLAAREEFERAAQRRVEENAALRRLFDGAAAAVEDAALRTRLEQAAASADPSLAVSELERTNADLRALLIELHAHVEELDTPAARAADEEIWCELARSTERRRLSLAVF